MYIALGLDFTSAQHHGGYRELEARTGDGARSKIAERNLSMHGSVLIL